MNEATAAVQLGITEPALRSRLRSLYARLGVNSAGQARHVLAVRDGGNLNLSEKMGPGPIPRVVSEALEP